MRSGLLLVISLLLLSALRASDPADRRFDVVEAQPVRTSIYVGTVTLTASPFHRSGTVFAADYQAKVWPLFFYSEKGRLVVNVPDSDLRRLAAGQPIDFSGKAIRSDGAVRLIDGRATPTGPWAGLLKVRIHLGRHFTLVFNTSYRLAGLTATPARSPAPRRGRGFSPPDKSPRSSAPDPPEASAPPAAGSAAA